MYKQISQQLGINNHTSISIMSATLHNNVRLRVFLILVISMVIRITRANSSSSVHKATGILETNYILYGIIILCSLLPFQAAWIGAFVLQASACVLDILCLALGTLATYRCRTQTGCIQTMPMSLISLLFVFSIAIIDITQTWDVYRIIMSPLYISSSTQRVRILFAWALPFAWLVNISIVLDSSWHMFKYTTAHLVVDPLVIIMANSHETSFIGVLIVIVIVLDALVYTTTENTLVSKATLVQMSFSIGALLVLFVSSSPTEAVEELEVPTEFEATEATVYQTQIRHRKKSKKESENKKITF